MRHYVNSLKRSVRLNRVSFWSHGYCVSATGYDEGIIQNNIRNKEEQDKKVDQLSMIFD